METNETKKNIVFHVTEFTGSLMCLRSFVLSIDAEQQPPSEAAMFGTSVHSIIESKFGCKPPDFDDETERILKAPETVYEGIDIDSSVCIWDALHPNMFGSERRLEHFELECKKKIKVAGWEINICGTMDASDMDHRFIVDWKTTSKSPSKMPTESLGNYYYQQILYRSMLVPNWEKMGIGIGCLAFIVKTKIPKFVCRYFCINDRVLHQLDLLLDNACNALVTYMESGKKKVPAVSFSDLCRWCKVKDRCNETNPMLPDRIIKEQL